MEITEGLVAKTLDGFRAAMTYIFASRDAVDINTNLKDVDDLRQMGFSPDMLACISILVMRFLLEQGTREPNRLCSSPEIRQYLLALPDSFGIDRSNVDDLLRYIVMVNLQNGGRLRKHAVYDEEKKKVVTVTEPILRESYGDVTLTDAGYDVLFRSHQYAVEYNFNSHAHYLKYCIENSQFSEGRHESEEILQHERQTIRQIESFHARAEESVLDLDNEEYSRYAELAFSRQEDLKLLHQLETQIEQTTRLMEGATSEGVKEDLDPEKAADINATLENIRMIIHLLQSMINMTSAFSRRYEELLAYVQTAPPSKAMDLRTKIMIPASHLNPAQLMALFDRTMARLMVPKAEMMFAPADLLRMRPKDETQQMDAPNDEAIEDDNVPADTLIANKATVACAALLLAWLRKTGGGRLDTFLHSFDREGLEHKRLLLQEGRIFNMVHDLYEMTAAKGFQLPTRFQEPDETLLTLTPTEDYETLFKMAGVLFQERTYLYVKSTGSEMTATLSAEYGRVSYVCTDFEIAIETEEGK